jgi:hypothetical protein
MVPAAVHPASQCYLDTDTLSIQFATVTILQQNQTLLRILSR